MGDMNSEEIAEFNRLCAEYMWDIFDIGFINGRLYGETHCGRAIDGFDPYHNANDRNRVIEKWLLLRA